VKVESHLEHGGHWGKSLMEKALLQTLGKILDDNYPHFVMQLLASNSKLKKLGIKVSKVNI
jgi:hypothetical protein